jgi:hypothetical protein
MNPFGGAVQNQQNNPILSHPAYATLFRGALNGFTQPFGGIQHGSTDFNSANGIFQTFPTYQNNKGRADTLTQGSGYFNPSDVFKQQFNAQPFGHGGYHSGPAYFDQGGYNGFSDAKNAQAWSPQMQGLITNAFNMDSGGGPAGMRNVALENRLGRQSPLLSYLSNPFGSFY